MAASTATILLGTLAAAGTGVSIYGNVKANQTQAQAERANAAFLQEQARFAKEATLRELSIFRDTARDVLSEQVSAFGASGSDLSGSPMLVLAKTEARRVKEEAAIIEDGRMKEREAYLKAGASIEQADRLSSWEANWLPAVGQVLTTGSGFVARAQRKDL